MAKKGKGEMMRVELSIRQACAIANLCESATEQIKEIVFEESDSGLRLAEREMIMEKMVEKISLILDLKDSAKALRAAIDRERKGVET